MKSLRRALLGERSPWREFRLNRGDCVVPVCTKCGRDVPKKTSIYKVMKTGSYGDGGNFYRQVSLCPRCAEQAEKEEQDKKKKTKQLVLIGIVFVVLGAVYWFVLRPQ